MAQKTLNAFVVIGGRVDNSFGRIGTALINMGSTIDEVSQKLINFGKESVEVYRGYEDSMLDAEVALSTTYGRGTKALQGVMKQLDAQATEWAASTIFHTDDVANAIAQAAHANWDLDKILDGIPAAMKLAQAGGLDLSESVDYIIKSVNGLGLEFGDVTQFVDEWTFAANSSAGDVRSFGDAMLRMGSTMRFARNKEELLTLIAVTHDAGATGAEAGTLIRNSMMRLVAPTKKANDAFKQLGASSDELADLVDDVALAEANAQLEAHGFSAFDQKGNLKPVLDIYRELYMSLGDIAGGYENITTNQDSLKILGSIFPTRTITEAITLLNAASKGYNGLYDAMMGGDANGYGEYAAETMMSGLTGSVETFESKVERLKQLVGEQLAPQVESIATNFGKVIDLLASGGGDNGVSSGLDMVERFATWIGTLADNMEGMDPAVFDGLSAGLGAIATLGPGLIIAGTGFRFIGYALGTNVGRIAMAAAVIYALAEAANKFQEAKFKENFGNMELDTTELNKKLADINTDFTTATAGIESFKTALTESVTAYNTAAEEFSSQSLSDMLTQKQLTEADLLKYQGWGTSMVNAVKQGITDSADMSAEFWMALFRGKGDTDEDLANNQIFAGIIAELNAEKEENIGQVEAIGQQLQAAITAAFADGELSEAEYENIKSYFRDLNEKIVEAQREAQSEQDFVKRKMLMDKAQNMSYDSMMNFIDNDLGAQRQAELDYWEENFKGNRYALQYRYEQKLAEAQTDAERAELDAYYQPLLAGADEGWAKKRAETYASYDQMILDLMDVAMHEGDLSEADAYWSNLIDRMQEGTILPSIAMDMMNTSEYNKLRGFAGLGGSASNDLERYYRDEVKRLGGEEEIQRRIAQYMASGDTVMAGRLQDVLDKYNYIGLKGTQKESMTLPENMSPRDMLAMVNAMATGGDNDLLNYFKAFSAGDEGAIYMYQRELSEKEGVLAKRMVESLSAAFDFSKVIDSDEVARGLVNQSRKDTYAAWKLMNMPTTEAVQYMYNPPTLQLPQKNEGASTSLTVEGAAEAANAAFQEAQGTLDELGDLSEGANVTGGAAAASAAYNEMQSYANQHPVTYRSTLTGGGGTNVGGSFRTFALKAKGGRETRPSIFAEAGIPEWYIPEEHTDNTLDLVLAAAYGSGFSILDLAERAGARLFADGGTDGSGSLNWSTLPSSASSGGGNDIGNSGSGSGITVQYSPVIHADNAQGVESVLLADKKRLEKWMEEWWAKRQLYESMVTYQ